MSDTPQEPAEEDPAEQPRRPGHSKLVYDKATRTIVTMREEPVVGLTGIAALEAEMRDRLAAKDADITAAYQCGRREGREEAAKAIEAVYSQHGPDRSMHYEEAVEIIRSLPQEGG